MLVHKILDHAHDVWHNDVMCIHAMSTHLRSNNVSRKSQRFTLFFCLLYLHVCIQGQYWLTLTAACVDVLCLAGSCKQWAVVSQVVHQQLQQFTAGTPFVHSAFWCTDIIHELYGHLWNRGVRWTTECSLGALPDVVSADVELGYWWSGGDGRSKPSQNVFSCLICADCVTPTNSIELCWNVKSLPDYLLDINWLSQVDLAVVLLLMSPKNLKWLINWLRWTDRQTLPIAWCML